MSSLAAAITTTDAKKPTEAKPVKLRAACNCCFAAKVRCDGNKSGCKRCTEKRLECTYSESMVGKVVGKRRKRPLPDSKVHEPKPNQWNVAVGPAALPSPAPTVASEQRRPSCTPNDWSNLIAYDEQSPLDFSQCDEQQYFDLEMAQSIEPSTKDVPFTMQTCLPTPSVSPPNVQYLSPADLETASQSRSSSTAPQQAIFQQPPPPFQGFAQIEDDETVCIKLLAHLKRFSTQEQHSFNSAVSLINRTNAALRRLQRSSTIRSDYASHLLLTNIVLHLTTFCENLLVLLESQRRARPEEEFINETYFAENDGIYSEQQQGPPGLIAKNAVQEAAIICSSIGDLLKRKPLNGFQVLGRQESAHVEVDVRLRRVISSLS